MINRNIAILPTTIDFTNSNCSVVTTNGTMADCIKKGNMKSGNIFATKSFFLPRPTYKIQVY